MATTGAFTLWDVMGLEFRLEVECEELENCEEYFRKTPPDFVTTGIIADAVPVIRIAKLK